MRFESRMRGPRHGRSGGVRAWLGLIRAPVCTLAFFGTYMGALLSGYRCLALGDLANPDTLLLALSMVCLCAASMLLNDACDVPADRINKPNRALVIGDVAVAHAVAASLVLFALSIFLASTLGRVAGSLVALMSIGSLLYSLRLKTVPWIGNTIVAVIGSSPVWIFAFLAESPGQLFLMACLSAILLFLGEEVIKTSEDLAGDAATGTATVASMHGPSSANRYGLIASGGAMGLTAVPLWNHVVTPLYVVCFMVCISILAAMTMSAFKTDGGTVETSRSLLYRIRWIKVVMLLGLALGLQPGL